MRTRVQTVGADVPRYGWQERAACRDQPVELFFGTDGEPKAQRQAREARAVALCGTCPVRLRCLEHAGLVPERYGVWGGTTEEDRLSGRRQERVPAAA